MELGEPQMEDKVVGTSTEDEEVDEEEEGEPVGFLQSARQVLYCPMCGLPPEFCEFNSKKVFNKCKPWLIKNLPDLYPYLKEEEEKKKKKAKRPKGTFYTWYDIGLFHNVRTAQIEKKEAVHYRGKIKLHGTNVAVTIQHNGNEVYIQSRNTFLTKEADHHGFAQWALHKEAKDYFRSLFRRNGGYRALTVYGEWCGKGIMKGAAICKLDKRLFAVFAVLLDKTRLITSPDKIEQFLNASAGAKARPDGMVIIPWVTEEVPLVFSDKEQLLPRVDEMNRLVEAVDNEDPWVKETFGVSGTGEGVVWYPVGLDDADGIVPLDAFRELVFKTKGPTHTMVSSKRSVLIAPEVVDSAEAFMEMFVTEPRLRQGWEEVCRRGNTEEERDATLDLQKMGSFVEWVCKDVEKESKDELKESNLTWQQVSGLVNVKARKWFLAEINKRGGVTIADDDLAVTASSSSSSSTST